MKRYWEYVKEYTEKTQNARPGYKIIKPELWIGLKFLDDNGIGQPCKPEEKEKLKKVLANYGVPDYMLFIRAIYGTFDAAKEMSERNDF